MDAVVHLLAGYVLAKSGLGRKCRWGTWLLLVASLLPDLDLLAGFAGSVWLVTLHRGPTHSLLLAPLLAVVPWVAVMALLPKGSERRWAYGLCLIGVASHDLVDWASSYGVQAGFPLSQAFSSLDLVHPVDVVGITILALGAIGSTVSALVEWEITRRAGAGQRVARLALLLAAVYLGARWLSRQDVVATLESFTYEGELPRRVAAVPEAGSPFSWRAIVETRTAYWIARVDVWAGQFAPDQARPVYRSEPAPCVEASRRSLMLQAWLRRARFPYARCQPAGSEGAVVVEWVDLLVSDPGRGTSSILVTLDATGAVAGERSSLPFY